ncbi:hypothetical protein CDL12_07686 [Handroanthus impetiginosus]|uniref:Uncharacterized protein n=1 Tax=Handroanthus impetiginosus TaxID=429701 RepID=A0A2G9HQ28_9LAMI|nr:hypothetical protein CDL12_07686 [Handroanthus impetiginosus]
MQDEIEAPMWVDLTLECDAIYEDKDDEWFQISHPFHQCSAQELISTFSCSLEHCVVSAFDVQGPSSPKLPPSVSSSRGRHFKSGKQEPLVCSFTLNKQHPCKSLSSNSSLLNAESGKGIKNNVFDGKGDNHLNYKFDSVDESTLAEATTLVSSESVSSFSDKKLSTKSVAFGGGEGKSISTITSKDTTGKLIEASNQPLGATSGLLSNIRDSLRKSYVTRQATRVEVKVMRQLDRKSSSGKSSVGSSLHPRCNGMSSLTRENMEETPDSKNIMTMSQLSTNKVNRAHVHGAPAAQARNTCRKSDLRINRETSKTMNCKRNKEGYVTQKVNKCITLATAENSMRARGINQSTRTVDSGKENQSGKMALALKSSTRMKEAECNLWNPKIDKRKVYQTSGKTKLVSQRVLHVT